MCHMCSDSEEDRKRASEYNRMIAASLRALAARYELLASGKLRPHTEQWKESGPIARNVIRLLVEDWV